MLSDIGERSRADRGFAFALGAVLGVLVMLLGIFAASYNDSSPDGAGVATTAGQVGIHDDEESHADPGPADDAGSPGVEEFTVVAPESSSRLARCIAASRALQQPLDAAGPALDQWEVHVGAMNKLVVGAITLQQAWDFWNRTRVGAHRRVDRFEDAWTSLRQHGVDCPDPFLMAPATPALRPCARHVEAQLTVLDSARTSVRTWSRHVHHMDMLREGRLSPEDATAMWLSMWKRGVRDLDEYRRTTRDPRLSQACPESASAD
jgi:hypothetical protein